MNGDIPQDEFRTHAEAVNAIHVEATRAGRKFPPFNSAHEGYAVLAEEVDELWDDVKADNVEHAISEAIQVGAMAARFITDMRAKYGIEAGAL